MLIQYSRESICMGDDAGAGIYELDIPPQTSLKQLIEILSHGGYGNTWPVPCHYNECYWLIHTNIGPIAIVICDHLEKLHVEFQKYHPDRTIQEIGLHAVYACRPVTHWWKTIEQNNYKAVLESIIKAGQKLELLNYPLTYRMTHIDPVA